MRFLAICTLSLSVGLWAAACSSSEDDDTSDGGTNDGSGSDGGSDGGGGDDGGDDDGSGTGGGGGTDGGACVPLGDLCFDDHMGNEDPFEESCCDDGFCDVPMCTDSEPPHCMSYCVCMNDGQECLQVVDGTTVTDKPCCAGLACTGCQDTDKGEACVCRPE
jgi:hypothetical protein